MWQAMDASPENSSEVKTKRMRRPREEKDRVLSEGVSTLRSTRNTLRELKASQGGCRAGWQGEYEQVVGVGNSVGCKITLQENHCFRPKSITH